MLTEKKENKKENKSQPSDTCSLVKKRKPSLNKPFKMLEE